MLSKHENGANPNQRVAEYRSAVWPKSRRRREGIQSLDFNPRYFILKQMSESTPVRQQKRISNGYLIFLASIGLGLLIAISVFSFWSGRKYVSSEQWKVHSVEVLHVVSALEKMSERAETSQRGFLLTEEERFLSPYYDAKNVIVGTLPKLLALVRDNPDQTQRANEIDGLARARLAHLDDVISEIRREVARHTPRKFSERLKKDQIDLLRAKYADFNEAENRLLSQRTQIADTDFARASYITILGLVFSFILLGSVTYLLRNEIQRRARIQEALVSAQKKAIEASQMKSLFLANMSHELRTPLNGIIGMTRLLSETPLESDQSEYVETVRDSSNFLLSLINQILDLSKIESGKLQLEEVHFELRSLVESTRAIVAPLAVAKGLQMQVEVADGVPDHYLGDPLRLRQILLNLLNNSVKFSNAGEVKLKVSKNFESDSMVQILFAVSDQGVGFDQETRSKLFKAFSQGDDSTTRRFGGTGLGLSIAKELVEMMGGRIDVSSVVGEGSRFFFEVPLKSAKYEKSVTENAAAMLSDQSMLARKEKLTGRILIAEDNLTNQKVASAILKRLGCTFAIANNGAEALELLKRESFDLVLMDGQMPVMDGYQATRAIRRGEARAENINIPVIAVTANAIKGDLEICLLAGMNDYIAKPISVDDIELKIRKWLRAKSALVDVGTLKELVAIQADVRTSLVPELIDIFTTGSKEAIEVFRRTLREGDLEAFRREAHIFKSTCANVGAIRSREIVAALEKTSSFDDRKQIQELIDTLERECEASVTELKKYGAA